MHYDLVRSISLTWVWPALGKPLASTMHLYPPIAHYLGAIAGLVVGSPLLGMFVVAVASIFGCYVLLARTLATGSLPSFAVVAAIAIAGLAFGRSQHAVEGFQTLYNFFYAIWSGTACFWPMPLG